MNLETLPWAKVEEILRELIPTYTYCTPGSILCAATEAGRQVQTQKMSVESVSSTEDDASILAQYLPPLEKDCSVIVITDWCFSSGRQPFVFKSSDHATFVEQYYDQTGEFIFSGADVIIVIPDARRLILYNHEGYLGLIEFLAK